MLSQKESDWYNNLSETGKRATKQNIILTKALLNCRLEEKSKKNKGLLATSAFEPSKNKINLEDDEGKEDIDIFKISKPEKSKNMYKKIKNNEKYRQKYKYHDTHIKNMIKKEKQVIPSCTKYNPKYDSIRKGVKSLPLWNKITGRLYRKKETFEHKFYLQHENIEDTMAGKTFIDMSKQISKRYSDIPFISREYEDSRELSNSNINRPFTTRTNKNNNFRRLSSGISCYSSISNNNKKINYKKALRQTTSAFLLKKKIKKNELYDKIRKIKTNNNSKLEKTTNINNTTNINSLIDTSNNIDNKINKLNKSDEEDSNISTDSYDLFKHIYTKKIKQKKDNNNGTKNNISNLKSLLQKRIKENKKAPDFKKCLSRESLSKIEESKFSLTPYLLPNFNSVREKHVMMVFYDRKKHKINRPKSAKLLNLDNRYYYDEKKALDNINNHISIHPPDFNMMTSRPIDNEPLPSYMKNIFDRNNCYSISAYSLKLNNYRNRDFISMKSSFWPKLSFNKVINLNLLKSKKFLDNFIFDDNTELKNRFFGKALKFYNKNYEEIFKEEGLPKFDNVTFKSYDRKKY